MHTSIWETDKSTSFKDWTRLRWGCIFHFQTFPISRRCILWIREMIFLSPGNKLRWLWGMLCLQIWDSWKIQNTQREKRVRCCSYFETNKMRILKKSPNSCWKYLMNIWSWKHLSKFALCNPVHTSQSWIVGVLWVFPRFGHLCFIIFDIWKNLRQKICLNFVNKWGWQYVSWAILPATNLCLIEWTRRWPNSILRGIAISEKRNRPNTFHNQIREGVHKQQIRNI